MLFLKNFVLANNGSMFHVKHGAIIYYKPEACDN
jgi:hypothetical protein